MKLRQILLAAAAPLALAVPAHAAYVDASYSGAIQALGPAAPSSLSVGTAITFNVVYDPGKLVDYTAAFNAAYGTSFSSVETASLADDPNASLSITVGSVSFSKFDGLQYGTPFGDCNLAACGPAGLGVGDLPAATYIDGAFAGVSNILINGAGYSLDADPIADFFTGGFGLDGPATGPYDFYLGQGSLDNPFTTAAAVGNIDRSTLSITPASVPEPAAWSLMILGFGALGATLRRRGRRTPTLAAC